MPRKENPIIPLDLKGVPPVWQRALKYLEETAVKYSIFKDHCSIESVTHVLIAHYLIKKEWNPKHKLPSLRRESQPFIEALGEVYYQAFRLCENCFSEEIGFSKDYIHPTIWWSGSVQELAINEGGRMFRLKHPNLGKDKQIRFLQSQNRQLERYENPFSQDFEPHTWKLIQSSAKFAESAQGGTFYKDYWKPFRKARSNYVEQRKKKDALGLTRSDQGEVLVTLPGTKGQSKIPVEKWLSHP